MPSGLLLGNAGHGVVIGASCGLRNSGASDAGALDVFDSVHDHFLLLFGAEVNYVGDGVEVGNEGEGYASVLMKLLYQENLGKFVYRNTANFFGEAQKHEACLAVSHSSFGADVMIYFICLLYCFVGEVASSIFVCALNEQLLLVGKLEIHNVFLSLFLC